MQRTVDVMVAGAQKAGTSTLLAYLGRHPDLRAAVRPETVWFMQDREYGDGDFSPWTEHYFGPGADDDRIRVAKLAGLMNEPLGLERLRGLNPDVTVVVMLREPVARAYSAFWFFRRQGREPADTFETALDGDPARFGSDTESRRICTYVDRSTYVTHVGRLLDMFGRDRVHVLFLDEFQREPRCAVAPVLEALGVDGARLPDEGGRANAARAPRSATVARLIRPGGKLARTLRPVLPQTARDALRRAKRVNETALVTPPIDPATERALRERFAAPNRELEVLLGRPLPTGWTVAPASEPVPD